jgi:hypothetical protein
MNRQMGRKRPRADLPGFYPGRSSASLEIYCPLTTE